MLISDEDENALLEILLAIAGSTAVALIGRAVHQKIKLRSGSSGLEQAYLAGKMAQTIGTDAAKRATLEQLKAWIEKEKIRLSDKDVATVDQLRSETEKYIEGRMDAWKARTQAAIGNANRAFVANTETSSEERRLQAIDLLYSDLKVDAETFSNEISRLVQTEIHNYFQQGMVTDAPSDVKVYKIPRAGACPHCQRLHLKADGSPKIYSLKDVIGNSNLRKPAYDWKFTIGPVHPYCYCILYRTDQKAPPGPSKELAKSIQETPLRKTVLISPEQLFEDVKPYDDEAMNAGQERLIEAIREIFGDDIPI